MSAYDAWIDRTEEQEDMAAAAPLAGLAALLDHETSPWRAGEVPPLGHWLSFLPRARQSDIDVDGHPRRGGFLPPIELPRRMWAGGRLQFHGAIPVGAPILRRSTIAAVAPKTGASGEMVFVTVRHEVLAGGRVAVTEEQDLVYRDAPKGPAPPEGPPPEPRPADATRTVVPDPVMLFRFSALTFNSHRIHYDRDYAREEEGYPGLVVHGPLLATLLMDHALTSRPGANVARFEFRAQRPLFDTASFQLCLKDRDGGFDLWAQDAAGRVATSAKVELA